MTKCHFCSRDIDPSAKGVYRHVDGWVPNRSSGGGNQVRRAKELFQYACKTCIEVGPQQEALV